VNLVGVPYYEVKRYWPYLYTFIRDGLKPSGEDVSLNEVQKKVMERDYQLWAIYNDKITGAGISYISEEDGELVAWVYALGAKGFLKNAKDIMDQFILWAKGYGATKVRLRGRPGWIKVFPEMTVKDRFLELEI
jgi:hypothetical protein